MAGFLALGEDTWRMFWICWNIIGAQLTLSFFILINSVAFCNANTKCLSKSNDFGLDFISRPRNFMYYAFSIIHISVVTTFAKHLHYNMQLCLLPQRHPNIWCMIAHSFILIKQLLSECFSYLRVVCYYIFKCIVTAHTSKDTRLMCNKFINITNESLQYLY